VPPSPEYPLQDPRSGEAADLRCRCGRTTSWHQRPGSLMEAVFGNLQLDTDSSTAIDSLWLRLYHSRRCRVPSVAGCLGTFLHPPHPASVPHSWLETAEPAQFWQISQELKLVPATIYRDTRATRGGKLVVPRYLLFLGSAVAWARAAVQWRILALEREGFCSAPATLCYGSYTTDVCNVTIVHRAVRNENAIATG
jgi:hypothetical protein